VHKKGKFIFYPLIITSIFLGLFLLKRFNPSDVSFFLECPFKKITGYDCAGCGSQRAVHFILNGDFKSAWTMNPLLMLSLPYVIFGLIYQKVLNDKKLISKIRNKVYGLKATYFWFVIIVAFWIGRNLI